MKDFLAKVVETFTVGHLIVTLVSLISAILSIKNNLSLPHIPLLLNTLSGFFVACLSGYILLEMHWQPFLSSGVAYLLGQLGNYLMNVVLVAIKMAEVDPYSVAGKVIDLIWSWKLPFKDR